MVWYDDSQLLDEAYELDEAEEFQAEQEFYELFDYLLGIEGEQRRLRQTFILLDAHTTREGSLDYEKVIDPLVIQDSDTGQDALYFAYPAEDIERLAHTWIPYRDKKWSEL